MIITPTEAVGAIIAGIAVLFWLIVVTAIAVRAHHKHGELATEVIRLRRTRSASGPRTGAGSTNRLPRVPPGAAPNWRPDPEPPTTPTGRHAR